MKKLALLCALASVVLSGCGLFGNQTGKNGELTGVSDRPAWDNPMPFGMLTIPPGSYHMGNNEQDVPNSQLAHNRQITMSAFYIDDTEISNNEYRQFIQFMFQNGADGGTGGTSLQMGEASVDVPDSILKFLEGYYRKQYTPQELMEVVYPDTLVWLRDFSYSYNEPLVENYWWHPAFDNYPVVGVNWFGAQAFCQWRTMTYNSARIERDRIPLPRFRLPTEAEWEYAARGGFEHKIYPWEGPYMRNSRGCFLANFKPGRGDYIADNFEYTCPIKSYWPNDYGLYCMPGNVAEWCEDDYEETAYSYNHDLNPVYRDHTGRETRRVIRGGSWKDVAYFCSVGTRTYEYADTTKSFLGFRCVLSILGRSGAANIY
jgi:gliding motility-associated lipoprotein GldK